jgi:LacI family transcriptional regulator
MATIRELAARSGVSVATVSRVLNDYEDVSEKTRRKVLRIARELDYTPSGAARTLVMQRSHVLGVVLVTGEEHPDLQHPFLQEVLVGVKRLAGAEGYDLLLFATADTGNGFGTPDLVKRCRYHHVDGVVLIGVHAHDPEVRKLADSSIPCVAVDLDLLGRRTGYVISDNVEGARLAIRHLHEGGRTRIALIGGPTATRPGADRLLGYREELTRLELPYRDEYVREGDFYADSGYRATQELIAASEPPDAIFAASDLMAVGALRALEHAGLSVPDDVALVGFDDIQLASLVRPALTTVRQDGQGLGVAAAEALVRMLVEPEIGPPVQVLPVELVVRESTRTPAAGARPGAGG